MRGQARLNLAQHLTEGGVLDRPPFIEQAP
jgi:hypothetical protein